MRTIILFLLTILVLVFGSIAVFASPRFTPAAARPTPSPLFVIENPPPIPWKSGSQYWFSKAAFEASWADFNNMAIVLK